MSEQKRKNFSGQYKDKAALEALQKSAKTWVAKTRKTRILASRSSP